MNGERVLVLGGNGSIGKLFETNPQFKLANFRMEANIESMISEISKSKASCILNLAAVTNLDVCNERPDYTSLVNKEGPAKLFFAACEAGCQKFIQMSTSHVYGPSDKFKRFKVTDNCKPITLYGKSKLEAESKLISLSQKSQMHLSIIRLFSTITPTLRLGYLYSNLIVRAKARNYEPIPGLNSVRDFVFQREIKDGILREIELTKVSQITNLCSGNGTIIKDLVKTVFTQYGADYRKIENFYSCTDPADFLVGNPKIKLRIN